MLTTFNSGSPFNFAKQLLIYVPEIAEPVGRTQQQWQSESIAILGEVMEASRGRALNLYTSRKELEVSYSAIAPKLARLGHKSLKQGDGTNKALKEAFDKDEHSVLFGLKSFFTGVDIQGDSLRVVYVNKLNFTPPDDVIFAARAQAMDEGKANSFAKGGSFYGLQIPKMTLDLLQAIGRGVRTKEDSAVAVIGDTRLYTKGYGGKIRAAVEQAYPGVRFTRSLDETLTHLHSLET